MSEKRARSDGRMRSDLGLHRISCATAKVKGSLRNAMQGTTRKGLWIADTEGKTGARDWEKREKSENCHQMIRRDPPYPLRSSETRAQDRRNTLPLSSHPSLSRARQTEKNPALFAQVQSAASPPASFPRCTLCVHARTVPGVSGETLDHREPLDVRKGTETRLKVGERPPTRIKPGRGPDADRKRAERAKKQG